MRGSVTLWIALMLTLFSLAGCVGGDEAGDDIQVEDQEADGGQTGTTNTKTGGGQTGGGSDTTKEDTARSASLSVSSQGGQAPVDITFDLSATGTDGKTTWSLDYGDGETAEGKGSDLPTARSHQYVDGGKFVATFTVSYGDGEASSKDVVISVSTSETFTGTMLPPGAGPLAYVGTPSELGFPCDEDAPLAGVDGFWFDISALPDQAPYTLTVAATLDADTTWYDADCTYLNYHGPGFVGESETGITEPGADWVFVVHFAGTGDFSLEIG